MVSTARLSSWVIQVSHPLPPQSPLTSHCYLGVGKTSLLQRYTQNKFDPKNTTSTSGAFFVTKKIYVRGFKVRLQLWDTAGQERFRSMVRALTLFACLLVLIIISVTGTYVLSRSVPLF